MDRNKLYVILSTACVSGYIWLAININNSISGTFDPSVCLFKKVTTLPCPSCGSTRSVVGIVHGNFTEAFLTNPIGFIIAFALVIVPIWISIDLITRKDSLLKFYMAGEQFLKQQKIAIPMIALVIINWIWNIYKEL